MFASVRQSRVIDSVVDRAHVAPYFARDRRGGPVPIGVPPPAWCTRERVGRRCVRAPAMTDTGPSVPTEWESSARTVGDLTTALGAPVVTGGCDRSRVGGGRIPVNVATSALPGRLRWEHSERPDAAGCW
jgi:hypothetical protein